MLNTSIPLSGMQAPSVRLNAAANNIANMNSNGALPAAGQTSATPQAYQPVQVQQTAAAGGGTTASVNNVSPSFAAQYDPSASYANSQGLVATPNVDLLNQILDISVAKTDFTANTNVADAVNRMVKQTFELGP